MTRHDGIRKNSIPRKGNSLSVQSSFGQNRNKLSTYKMNNSWSYLLLGLAHDLDGNLRFDARGICLHVYCCHHYAAL
jgi:hypothetical protein